MPGPYIYVRCFGDEFAQHADGRRLDMQAAVRELNRLDLELAIAAYRIAELKKYVPPQKTWAGADGEPLPVDTSSRFAHGMSDMDARMLDGCLNFPVTDEPPSE